VFLSYLSEAVIASRLTIRLGNPKAKSDLMVRRCSFSLAKPVTGKQRKQTPFVHEGEGFEQQGKRKDLREMGRSFYFTGF